MARAHSLAVSLLLMTTVAQASATEQSIDVRLISTCAARTDARMESMTLGKLEQIRNYEFSLRMAMAQLAAGSSAMSPNDWQLATAALRHARTDLAQVCEISVPMNG